MDMACRKIFFRGVVISSIGIGSWISGVNFERRKLENELNFFGCGPKNKKLLKFVDYPGLPTFGTVYAASPIDRGPASQEIMPTSTSRISQIMKYGFPGLDNIKSYDDYVLSYDRRNRIPHWVFEHLTEKSVQPNKEIDRSLCDFTEDVTVHPYFRAKNSDYKGSGFDRGHMAAAGNHRIHQKHVEQTFTLSNIAPQVGKGFNRDSWNKLEKYVRKLTKKYTNVYVCTGPLYLPRKEDDGKMYVKYQVIGASTVAVPTHFFKVILCETSDNKLELEAYVMPNKVIDDNTPLHVFQVPPESVERAAGLLFFDRVSKEKIMAINGRHTKN